MAFFRLRGTILLSIWWQVLLVTIYTVGLVCFSNYVWEINIPQTLIPVLGFVTGLLLGFGTNASYDRYYEGKKLWVAMNYNIRTLTRTIWVMVKAKEGEESKTIVKKVSAINALLAFAYATKNYLREEYAYDAEDLRNLIKHIPHFSSLTPDQLSPTRRTHSGMQFAKYTPTNIPLELSYYIASYIEDVSTDGVSPSYIIPVMNTALNNMVECLAGFDRISSTPIPLTYSYHLTHVTWLFILALPFQLIGPLNWFAIPAVMLASFAILGIFGIGWEVQSPFGYDDNDMPLDDFCRLLHKEILTIISRPMPKAESWLLSSDNHPLEPSIQLPASHLITLKEEELRRLLSKISTGPGDDTNSDFKSVTVPEAESEELRPMISTAVKN